MFFCVLTPRYTDCTPATLSHSCHITATGDPHCCEPLLTAYSFLFSLFGPRRVQRTEKDGQGENEGNEHTAMPNAHTCCLGSRYFFFALFYSFSSSRAYTTSTNPQTKPLQDDNHYTCEQLLAGGFFCHWVQVVPLPLPGPLHLL